MRHRKTPTKWKLDWSVISIESKASRSNKPSTPRVCGIMWSNSDRVCPVINAHPAHWAIAKNTICSCFIMGRD